jgi:hypothetical protein
LNRNKVELMEREVVGVVCTCHESTTGCSPEDFFDIVFKNRHDSQNQACETFRGEGPQPLLWSGSRAAM